MKTKIQYWKRNTLNDLTKIKSVEELNKLNTRRLLAYFKAERMRKIRYNECFYDYNHGYSYEYTKELDFVIKNLHDWEMYLSLIKDILNTRENIGEYNKHR